MSPAGGFSRQPTPRQRRSAFLPRKFVGERPGAAGVTEERLPGPQNVSFAVVAPVFPPTLIMDPAMDRGVWLVKENAGILMHLM